MARVKNKMRKSKIRFTNSAIKHHKKRKRLLRIPTLTKLKTIIQTKTSELVLDGEWFPESDDTGEQ